MHTNVKVIPLAQQLERDSLKTKLIDYIHSSDKPTFNKLALELFAYQFTWNKHYGTYCKSLGVFPSNIISWREVPLVPVTSFKFFPVFAGDESLAPVCYYSSGTTLRDETNDKIAGRHYLWDTDLYDASLLKNFKDCVLPDKEKINIFSLVPTENDMPNSSLAHMIAVVMKKFGKEGSKVYVAKDGFKWECFLNRLRECEEKQTPVAIVGTLASFTHFFAMLKERFLKPVSLPIGSRIMDTGGDKGLAFALTREEFYQMAWEFLGIPDNMCVNEYGMSEMGSQFYDNIIVENCSRRKKIIPPWVESRVLHWDTFKDVEEEGEGILCHYDVTNLDSAFALQTEDIGIRLGSSFEILGRAKGAEERGCSLSMSEFLAAIKGN